MAEGSARIAKMNLEEVTFNPSVLGSNPRGPTTQFRRAREQSPTTNCLADPSLSPNEYQRAASAFAIYRRSRTYGRQLGYIVGAQVKFGERCLANSRCS